MAACAYTGKFEVFSVLIGQYGSYYVAVDQHFDADWFAHVQLVASPAPDLYICYEINVADKVFWAN